MLAAKTLLPTIWAAPPRAAAAIISSGDAPNAKTKPAPWLTEFAISSRVRILIATPIPSPGFRPPVPVAPMSYNSTVRFRRPYPISPTAFLAVAVLLLFLVVAGAPDAVAQRADLASGPLIEAASASVGMSADRLGRVDGMLRAAVENGDVPGVAALIARRGKIVYWKAYGSADAESGRALKRDDIFRIASQSKAITATAVMMLWEEGLFQLDDPIERYIPEFKDPVVLDRFRYADTTFTGKPAERSITIRHLLTHTSGIGYGVIDGDERFRMMYEKAGITDLFTSEKSASRRV